MIFCFNKQNTIKIGGFKGLPNTSNFCWMNTAIQYTNMILFPQILILHQYYNTFRIDNKDNEDNEDRYKYSTTLGLSHFATPSIVSNSYEFLEKLYSIMSNINKDVLSDQNETIELKKMYQTILNLKYKETTKRDLAHLYGFPPYDKELEILYNKLYELYDKYLKDGKYWDSDQKLLTKINEPIMAANPEICRQCKFNVTNYMNYCPTCEHCFICDTCFTEIQKQKYDNKACMNCEEKQRRINTKHEIDMALESDNQRSKEGKKSIYAPNIKPVLMREVLPFNPQQDEKLTDDAKNNFLILFYKKMINIKSREYSRNNYDIYTNPGIPQLDSSEFVNFIVNVVDCLYYVLNIINEPRIKYSLNSDLNFIILSIKIGLQKYFVTNDGSFIKTKGSSKDITNLLTLNINGAKSIQSMINNYLKIEIRDTCYFIDQENEINVYDNSPVNLKKNDCKYQGAATEILEIPEILNIMINRNYDLNSKDNTGLEINEKILLNGNNYKLLGFIEHYGNMGGGHYIFYRKNYNQFLCFNDSQVNTFSPNLVANSHVYQIAYQLENKKTLFIVRDNKIKDTAEFEIAIKEKNEHERIMREQLKKNAELSNFSFTISSSGVGKKRKKPKKKKQKKKKKKKKKKH